MTKSRILISAVLYKKSLEKTFYNVILVFVNQLRLKHYMKNTKVIKDFI